MSCTASEIIALAKKEIGTLEKGANNVKYNTAYYGGEVNGTAFAWCVVFIWWLFKKLKSTNLFCNGVKSAYVPYVMTWAITNKLTVSTPKPGDLVTFDWSGGNGGDHIGLVIENLGNGKIKTIEGNITGPRGAGVYEKTRSLDLVSMIVRPKYSDSGSNSSANKSDFQVAKDVIKGDYGNDQERKKNLVSHGYDYDTIQNIVNALLANKKNETIAKEVIAGKWGNGKTRKTKITNAGYNYGDVQTIVNGMLNG